MLDDEDGAGIQLHWLKSDDKSLIDNKVNLSEVYDPHFKVALNENKTSLSLTIDSVNRSDRAYYTCVATNDITNSTQVILLRVKGNIDSISCDVCVNLMLNVTNRQIGSALAFPWNCWRSRNIVHNYIHIRKATN